MLFIILEVAHLQEMYERGLRMYIRSYISIILHKQFNIIVQPTL